MKKTFLITLALLSAIFANQKVIGYFPTWSGSAELKKVQFKKLTHINFAFVQSDFSGNVRYTGWGSNEPELLSEMVDSARANNLIVMVSVNGNTGTGSHHIIKDDNDHLRKLFAQNIVKFALENDLDGIDLDIESLNDITYSERMNYGTLAAYIRDEIDKISSKKLYLSAAVGFTCDFDKQYFSDEFVNSVDWLNPMVYDLEGWWDGDPFRVQGPYNYFVQSGTTEWPTRLAKDKIVLGVPFYGYYHASKNATNGDQIAYKDILNSYQIIDDTTAGNENTGYVLYDGPELIRKKAEFVKNNNLGGVMIWDLSQDISDDRSLLNVIADVIEPQQSTPNISIGQAINKHFATISNGYLRVEKKMTGEFHLMVYSIKGVLINDICGNANNSSLLSVNAGMDKLASGCYILNFKNKGNNFTLKHNILK